jgi:hypothetical protein
MKRIIYQWLLVALCLFITSHINAQCPAGDFTAVTGGQYTLDGNKTLIISANVGNITLNISNTGNVICIAPGVTWTQTNQTNFNGSVNINVYGTFNYNSNDNFNSSVASYINVQPDGALNTNTSGIGSKLLINNQGTTTFTNTGNVQFRDAFAFYNFGPNSKLIATAPSMVVFGSNTVICNWGTMEFASLENADAKRFKNETSGVINISRYFYNHGSILNDGEINTLCGKFGSSACEFIIGDKGAGKEFENNGCMSIKGNVNIRGAAFNNGTITITDGDLTIDKKISGYGGAILVTNGKSVINSDGGYNGTDMFFWDENTPGHDFDEKKNNNPQTTAVYKVVKRTCVKEEAFGSIGDYVWYDTDRDGKQGKTELPVSGLKVQLYKYVVDNGTSSWTVQTGAVTDQYGKYLFDDLSTGKYKVQFILPSSGKAFFTYFKKSGVSADEDSDSNPDNGNFSDEIAIDTSFPSGDVKRDNMTIDAGIYEGSTPLPVTLVSFTTTKENETVLLNWATTAETNSESFDIQHSLNGKSWSSIGSVKAAGESSTKENYTFTDSNPADGQNLYRLKMIDSDGTFAYSTIRSVSLEVSDVAVVYPNPVADRLYFKVKDWNKIGRITLSDLNGKTIFQSSKQPVDGVDVKNLPAGLYAVNITRSTGGTSSYKIVISK